MHGSTSTVLTVRFLSPSHQQPCAIRASGGSPKSVVRAVLGAPYAASTPYMAPLATAPEGDQSLLHYTETRTLSLSAEIKVLLYAVSAPFSAGIITLLFTQRYVPLCRSRAITHASSKRMATCAPHATPSPKPPKSSPLLPAQHAAQMHEATSLHTLTIRLRCAATPVAKYGAAALNAGTVKTSRCINTFATSYLLLPHRRSRTPTHACPVRNK